MTQEEDQVVIGLMPFTKQKDINIYLCKSFFKLRDLNKSLCQEVIKMQCKIARLNQKLTLIENKKRKWRWIWNTK